MKKQIKKFDGKSIQSFNELNVVSALIPAVKAVRLTVLQALKQNESTGLKRRNVKVNPLLERLFGFEGKLADKNFKRNKRKQINGDVMQFL